MDASGSAHEGYVTATGLSLRPHWSFRFALRWFMNILCMLLFTPFMLWIVSCLSEYFSNMPVGAGERTGLCGESLEAVCSVGEQQGFPADVYPYARAAALLLHAWPRLRRLAHHDGSAGAAGVRHRHPQTLALRSHRTQPGEQEPPQTTPPQVNQESYAVLKKVASQNAVFYIFGKLPLCYTHQQRVLVVKIYKSYFHFALSVVLK